MSEAGSRTEAWKIILYLKVQIINPFDFLPSDLRPQTSLLGFIRSLT